MPIPGEKIWAVDTYEVTMRSYDVRAATRDEAEDIADRLRNGKRSRKAVYLGKNRFDMDQSYNVREVEESDADSR
jgi:hypothetical protein